MTAEGPLPIRWDSKHNVAWKAEVPGSGSSSPIVWDQRVLLTSAMEQGTRRALHCFDLHSGEALWSHLVEHDEPELTSSLTGYAAATPATDGSSVVAFFGNAGVVCCDLEGRRRWHRPLEPFETELGLASSPIIYQNKVILVCDHDGAAFRNFDSFLLALDLESGRTAWRTERPRLYRSWSTPIVVPTDGADELIVNAQDELRGYGLEDGRLLWSVRGMTGWVTPSPVSGHGLIFAASGRDGPTMAVRAGGRGDVTHSHVVWRIERGSPYVCSPLLVGDQLYVLNDAGILRCLDARSGRQLYEQRLPGNFFSSPVAGDGKLYCTNDDGTTYVVQTGPEYHLLARNQLEDTVLASPALVPGALLMRTATGLWRINSP